MGNIVSRKNIIVYLVVYCAWLGDSFITFGQQRLSLANDTNLSISKPNYKTHSFKIKFCVN